MDQNMYMITYQIEKIWRGYRNTNGVCTLMRPSVNRDAVKDCFLIDAKVTPVRAKDPTQLFYVPITPKTMNLSSKDRLTIKMPFCPDDPSGCWINPNAMRITDAPMP